MNANLEFSKVEYELVVNSDFILTKNRIIEKIYVLYGLLSNEYKNLLQDKNKCLPEAVFTIAPKIYKGEQYRNLPYVMLDYPRLFTKQNVFAIRSFFWWGNYFSITLQLSGVYLQQYAENIKAFISNKKNNEWYFGVHASEWEHHFEKDNYSAFETLNANEIDQLQNKNFIKIACKLPLQDWKIADEFFLQQYKKLLNIFCTD